MPLSFCIIILGLICGDVLDQMKPIIEEINANALDRAGGFVVNPQIINEILATIPDLGCFDVERKIVSSFDDLPVVRSSQSGQRWNYAIISDQRQATSNEDRT